MLREQLLAPSAPVTGFIQGSGYGFLHPPLMSKQGRNVQDRSKRTLAISRFPRAASYEHIGAGVVEIDQDGRIVRVNQYSCELTGCSAPELLGGSIFGETHPRDVDHDRAQFNSQLAGKIDRYTIEKRLCRKNGEFFWAEVTSSSVRDADGRFLYAVRVPHDIRGARKRLPRQGRD